MITTKDFTNLRDMKIFLSFTDKFMNSSKTYLSTSLFAVHHQHMYDEFSFTYETFENIRSPPKSLG